MLEAGYLPKVIVSEINPDIPPPFRWHLEEDPGGFTFDSHQSRGTYGASADALYALLSGSSSLIDGRNGLGGHRGGYGYSLVGVELVDLLLETQCGYECEHNMWFVRNDLLGLAPHTPLVSWQGMVRLFWGQVQNKELKQLGAGWCLHIKRQPNTHGRPCPLHELEPLTRSLGAPEGITLAQQSFFLSLPRYYEGTFGYATKLNEYLEANCKPHCRGHISITRY